MEKDKNKLSKKHLDAALSETGREVGSAEALRRYLVNTKDEIDIAVSHRAEEALSDVFAFFEGGEAIFDAVNEADASPLLDNISALIATSAALYLINSINTQLSGKRADFKKALKMFVEFEHDKNSNNHLITEDISDEERHKYKSVAREMAIVKLREKMLHSGLQFVNLPKTDTKFNRSEFFKIASNMGVGTPLSLKSVNRVSSFLKKPFFEKIEATGEGLSYLGYQYGRGLNFLIHVGGEFLKNTIPARIRRIGLVTDQALFVETPKLRADIKKFSRYKDSKKTLSGTLSSAFSNKGSKDTSSGKKAEKPLGEGLSKQTQELSLSDLHKVHIKKMAAIGKDWSEEEKRDLAKVLKDGAFHTNNAVRARNSLIIQGIFEVAQIYTFVDKAFRGQWDSMWMNAYSFFAAMGPLAGFANELKDERAIVNSLKAKEALILDSMVHVNVDSDNENDSDLLEKNEP